MHVRLRQSIVNARRVTSVRADIYHPAVAACEGKSCLTAGNFRAERKAADAALELIHHAKATVRVRSRRPERLPMTAVMHEQSTIAPCGGIGPRTCRSA